jgi:aquaporin Z
MGAPRTTDDEHDPGADPRRPGDARPRPPDDPPDEPKLATRVLVEAFGAFALTFVAAGGDVMGAVSGGEVTAMARAIAPGLLVMAMVYALGDRSGAHFNPAVTTAFALRRLFPVRLVPAYVVAQLGGAVLAAIVLAVLFGPAAGAGVTRPKLVEPGAAAAIEAILTLLLVVVILGTADRARIVGPNAALAVGGTIALCGLIALPIEGASMNPARSTGPALVAGELSTLWVYWVGPLLGAVAAVLLERVVRGPVRRTDREARKAAGGQAQQGTHDDRGHAPATG